MLVTHWTPTAQNAIVEFRKKAIPSVTLFLGALIQSTYVLTAYSVAEEMECKERNYFAWVNPFNGPIDTRFAGPLTDRCRIAFIRVRSFE